MDYQSHQIVLLTGAGFSKNFGGFLGDEMWVKIFNNPAIQNQEKIRQALLDDEAFGFEYVYSKVINDEAFSDTEKQLLKRAVEESFESLDVIVRNWRFNNDNPTAFNSYLLDDFLKRLIAGPGRKGFFFTLNQDLLVERRWGYYVPGIFFRSDTYRSNGQALSKDDFARLPVISGLEQIKNELNSRSGVIYVKLHGSYGWFSSNGEMQIVIGTTKEEDIHKEPLLNWYFEMFQSVIREGNKKLLAIGYGFRDQHINNILLDGAENYGLKLYIIDPMNPRCFKENLRNGHYYAMPLWSAIGGYFPYTFKETFPSDQSKSAQYEEIVKTLEL